MDGRPCFYLIILRNEKPQIPPGFFRHISALETEKATLKCPSGGIWSIKLRKSRDSVFLGAGWKDFALAHSLREHDFLVFTHDVNMCFDVRIFNPNGLERVEDGCQRRDHQSSAHCQGKRGKLKESSEEDIYEVKEREKFLPYEKTRNQKLKSDYHCRKAGKLKGSSEEDVFEVPEWEEDFVPYEKTRYQNVNSNNHFNKQGKLKKCTEEEEEVCEVKIEMEDYLQPYEKMEYQKVKKETRASSSSQNRAGNEICRTSESFRSRFPFFLKHLKEYHVDRNFILNIPNDFARKHLPGKKTKITLWNQEGQSWKVILNPGPNQTNFGAGWMAYVTANKLRRGQVCVFELVEDLQLRVHTFSA